MRNGNLKKELLPGKKSIVLILPMRNGNQSSLFIKENLESSYPTYEEWKPSFRQTIFASSLSSYPTYEEWKPKIRLVINWNSRRSYPTYEEWTLFEFWIILISNTVLILPMRNGNSEKSNILSGLNSVLILPMRNGNAFFSRYFPIASSLFLSYLWGMETGLRHGVPWTHATFLSYLWGMETNSSFLFSSRYFLVLILPMRNGNFHRLS